MQFIGAELTQAGNFTKQLALERAIRQCHPHRLGVAGQVRTALGALQVATFAGHFDQHSAQGHGFRDGMGECIFAKGAYVAIGVMLGGQKQKLDASDIRGITQRAI